MERMGNKDRVESPTHGEAKVTTSNVQLDPGLKDWRHYQIAWNNTLLADVIATRVASGAYAAGKEYWQVDKASLTTESSLTITASDHSWTDSTPKPPSAAQEFESNTAATWQEVQTDLTTGTLYKHATKDYYVRIAISGTAPSATITKVRWYRQSSSGNSASIDPSGSYATVGSLGSGAFLYADSK